MSAIAEAIRSLSWSSLLTLATLHRPYLNAALVQLNIAMDKLRPNDPRYTREYAVVNGHKWSYLDAKPNGETKGTVFLIHGFPDISLAWRYQIPLLLKLGFRCIALDCMGYGETGTTTNLQDFTYKTHADAVAGIAAQQGLTRIILGGHDWGGMAVYRVAQWYPKLVSHVFSVCTPYMPVQDDYVPLSQLVTKLPNFGYQLQFGSADQKVEKVVKGEVAMRKFLAGMYGGKPSTDTPVMTPEHGVDLKVITDGEVGPSPLLNEEELSYYVKEFCKNGINGPLNWYRVREHNYKDELKMPAEDRKGLRQPVLYVFATKDFVLTRELGLGMEKAIPNLSRGEVPATHWALWHTPQETNAIIERWFEGVVLGGKTKL